MTDALDIGLLHLLHLPEGFPGTGLHASLILVREADGTQTVGMLGEWDGDLKHTWKEPSQPVSCRAFLIEPEVLARLEEVVPKACGSSHGSVLAHAFAAETIGSNQDVARLLAAIPDLDGDARNGQLRCHRLPIAGEFDTFPPRPGPLTVVLVFNDPPTAIPAEPTPANRSRSEVRPEE